MEQQGNYESQWAAIVSISEKIICARRTLQCSVRQAERDNGQRAGLTTNERKRLRELEKENRELKRSIEILRTASVLFAQAELDRKHRRSLTLLISKGEHTVSSRSAGNGRSHRWCIATTKRSRSIRHSDTDHRNPLTWWRSSPWIGLTGTTTEASWSQSRIGLHGKRKWIIISSG